MGSAWGHGYHKGFEAGAKQGGTTVGLVLLGVGGVVALGKWGFEKMKARKLTAADETAADIDDVEIDQSPN